MSPAHRSAAALLAALAAFSSSSVARAAERRTVAVLEHRAGAEGAPNLAARIAGRLAKTAALNVIDPAEARRRKERVDAEVGRCGGQIECLARLGVTLDADEVLLVAISQLGDLVVNVQRIDIDRQKSLTQFSEVIAIDGPVSDEKLDEWLRKLYPPETFKRYGTIAVTANVDGARLTINNQDKGETPLARKLRVLAPRSYNVSLTKKGYLPFSASIDVVPDANVEVRAELAPEEPAQPWYKRWYVWAVVGGVVAGGAIGTALYVTRPDNDHDAVFIVLPAK